MKMFLRQSYDVFNMFGKTHDQMRNTLYAFLEVTADIHVDDIGKGFADWLKTKGTMPAPADIRSRSLEFQEFRLSRLKPKIDNVRVAAIEDKSKFVSWYDMQHSQILEAGLMKDLEYHMINVLEPLKREEYAKYLVTWCKFPKEFLAQYRLEDA